MTDERASTLEERVRRLEEGFEEQGRELRYVRRRLSRMMADRGSVATERETAAREAPARMTETPASFASVGKDPATMATSETSRREPSRSGIAETAASGGGFGRNVEDSRETRRGFELPVLPFDLGDLRSGEWWLNKVGIALLLLGIGFLFKFSWDQGWLQALLTPIVRVGIGVSVSTLLVGSGLRVYGERRAFSQVLLGGGIGAYYITGFAAFQMLGVFSYPVAFAFMIAVTVLAFALSLRQDEAVIAPIGVTGGMATPFLLYDDSGSLAGLVLYASLVLAGAMGIYLFKGWRSLLPISFIGFWTVLLVGYAGTANFLETAAGGDRRALQAGVVFAWIALWLVPAVREVLRSRDPSRWPLPEPGALARALSDGERFLRGGALVHGFSFATPLVALLFTQGIWDLEKTSLGWVALGLAAAHALAFAGFRRVESGGDRMSYTQALVALLLGTLSLVLVLEGNALLFTLAAEAAALHLLARRLSDRVLSLEGHLLFLVVGVWLFVGLAAGTVEGVFAASSPAPFLDVRTLVDLAAVALAFASSLVVAPEPVRRAYRIVAHAVVAGLILRELLPLDNGGTYALSAWATYAAGLHLLSRRCPAWGTLIGAHLLFAAVGVWLGARLVGGALVAPDSAATVVPNLRGLGDLFVILLAVAVSLLPLRPEAKAAHRVLAHAGLLAWLWRELSALPGSASEAYVSVAWGVCGVGLLVLGLRRDHAYLIRGGMATLFLVVAKLFLWDLAWVEAIWRVLLFMGFGGLFLVLSYYLRELWRPSGGEEPLADHAQRKV